MANPADKQSAGGTPAPTPPNQGNTVRQSWPFSADAIRANLSHCSPDIVELFVWALIYCNSPAHEMRFDEFADRLGHNRNTLYKVFAGKYYHPSEAGKRLAPPEKLVRAIRSFRRAEVMRSKLGQTRFVLTPTAKAITDACDLARESQSPVFLEGASQIGKTYGLRHYTAEHNHGHTTLIELDTDTSPSGLLKMLAPKVGVAENNDKGTLLARIQRGITQDMLLIFDEMHLLQLMQRRQLFYNCCEIIRRIHDKCGCGMVFSFTRFGFEKAEKERRRELEQLFRRGVHHINLGDRPTVDDVRMITEAWGLEFPARNEDVEIPLGKGEVIRERPFAVIEQLARDEGLKAIVERLRYGAKFAADTSAPLSWEHVLRADLIVRRNAQPPVHGWTEERGAA